MKDRALSGAIAPEHDDEFACTHIKRNPMNDLCFAVCDPQIAYIEQDLFWSAGLGRGCKVHHAPR
jgi:hypothetical protein